MTLVCVTDESNPLWGGVVLTYGNPDQRAIRTYPKEEYLWGKDNLNQNLQDAWKYRLTMRSYNLLASFIPKHT